MNKGLNENGNNVAFFDSGIGGLNLLYECAVRAPEFQYCYISDNSNVPYGNRSADEICSMTFNALKGLEKLNPSALVIACNTVTADCIAKMRERFCFPVVGIQPAIKQAAEVGGTCLAIATEATVSSLSFQNLASRFPELKLIIHASKELAAFVEENIFNLPESLPSGLLPDVKVDSVVLGCTHYVYVKRQIENYYKCKVFDGIEGTARNFARIVGMSDHDYPPIGTDDHFNKNKLKITFVGQNRQKNELVFEKILHNKL